MGAGETGTVSAAHAVAATSATNAGNIRVTRFKGTTPEICVYIYLLV
jgi:hypothetical protein